MNMNINLSLMVFYQFFSREDLIEVNECLYEILGYEYDSESAQELTKEQLIKDQKKAVDHVGHQVYIDVCMSLLQARLNS